MDASSAAAQLHRMPQMQHFVIDQVFHCITRHIGAIKHLADHNGVMRRIVMSQAKLGVAATPGHLRTRHQAIEKPGIQFFKDLLQIEIFAFGSQQSLAPAHLSDQVHPGDNIFASGKFAKTYSVCAINFFAVELGDQDVQYGMEHRFRRSFQQIRDSNQQASFTKADSVIELREREELDGEFWQRSSRAELTVGLVEDSFHIPSGARKPYSRVRVWVSVIVSFDALIASLSVDFIIKTH